MTDAAEGDPVLTPASVRYQNDQPYALDFQDIYHAADGAAEVARVFIAPCGVDDLARERGRRAEPDARVRIGELGFGSGLNFVIAAERCLAAGARLMFFSCEARPIAATDFAAIAAQRQGAHPLYRELAAAYPPPIRGWHQRLLAGGRVQLMLWLGTAADALSDLAGRQRQPLDAWFLDGFAPDRNPELWEPSLFQAMASLSRAGTRAATFTAAGRVRRGLEAAGFSMARVDQRPHKRESLAGTFSRTGLTAFQPPRRVTVVGGGLAGAATAWRLARSGFEVEVFEPGPAEPPAASTLPATVLHARLLNDASSQAALRCHGYLHAAALHPSMPGFQAAGALQLAGGTQTPAKLQAIAARYAPSGPWVRWLDGNEAAELAAWPAGEGGLYLPDAGVVQVPALVAGLLGHGNVHASSRHVSEVPVQRPLVLACGAEVGTFAPARYLEVAPVQGQLDLVAVDARPELPLVGGRYLVPTSAGLLAAGSTYEHRPWNPEEASRHNLAQLAGMDYRWQGRCRGTRSVSSDRTAIAGPLFDANGEALEGLYVSTGHGSAGNVSTHLAAAVIEARITGDCPPLARHLEAALSPRRFRDRQARRGYRHGAGD